MDADVERAKHGISHSLKLGLAQSILDSESSLYGKEMIELDPISSRVIESLFDDPDSRNTLINLFKQSQPDADPLVNAEQAGHLLQLPTRGTKVMCNAELEDRLVRTENHDILIKLSDLLCWKVSQPGNGVSFGPQEEWVPESMYELVKELDAYWLSDQENEEQLAAEMKRRSDDQKFFKSNG